MEDHAPDNKGDLQYQVYHLTWILKQVKRSNRHQKGEPSRDPHPRLQELLVEEHYYAEDVVIENDNSYICDLILVQWLFVNYMLFPIMYCAVFAIVQNVIFMSAELKIMIKK